MSNHQKLINEIVGKIETRRDSYGSILVKSAIVKSNDVWENIVTKILPLHKSDSYVPNEKLDYGDLIIFEEFISLDSLIKIIKDLPEKGITKITLENYEIKVEGEYFQNGYKYDSGEVYLNVGWFFERYHYRSRLKVRPKEPLVSKDLPLFPDFREAIHEYMGIDMRRYSESYGIIICLPRYDARIVEVNIGSKEIRLTVEPKEVDIENLVAKLYCERGGEVKHADIEFEEDTGVASIGFKPETMYVALVLKTDNEVIDRRQYYSSWESVPKGVVIDIPEYGIKELILHGEGETIEFKEKIGRPEKIAVTAVAFANNRGGVILFGVNDSSVVVGITEEKAEETITNILRSHCNPQLKFEINKRKIKENDIILVHIEEGRDKPYFVRDKGPYIRAHSTNRVMTKQELDEIYEQKQPKYRPAY